MKPLNSSLEAALCYLNHHACSERQLIQKLKDAGFTEAAIEESLSQAKKWNYVDDRKFGESRIHQLKARMKSRAFVFHDLESHGVSKEMTHELMDAYYPEESELEIAAALIRKKATPGKSKIKVSAYLVRNGFSENTVRQCLPSIDPT